MQFASFRLEDILGNRGVGGGPEGADMGMINLHAAQARFADNGAVAGGGGERRYPDRQRQAPISYEQLMAERDAEEEELGDLRQKGKPKRYRLMGLRSHAEWAEQWGNPKPQEECFACLYNSQRGKFEVPISDMRTIIEMMRTCPAKMTFGALAVQLSAKQVEMTTRLNADKPYGDPRRIPEWDPATVYAHLRYHIPAPELQTRKIIGDMAEVYDFILANCLIQVDKEDGDMSVNEAASRVLERIVRIQTTAMKSNLKSMAFYAPNTVLEEKLIGQPVALDQMRLVAQLRKNKRRR